MGASTPSSFSPFRGVPCGCPGACRRSPRRLPHERAPPARRCRACGEALLTPRRRPLCARFPLGFVRRGRDRAGSETALRPLRAPGAHPFAFPLTAFAPHPGFSKTSDAGPSGRQQSGPAPHPASRAACLRLAPGRAFLPRQPGQAPPADPNARRFGRNRRQVFHQVDYFASRFLRCRSEAGARPRWVRVPGWSPGRPGAASGSRGEGTAFPVRWRINRDPDFAEPRGH